VRLEAVPRTEDSLTSSKERGPGRELTLSFGSSFFCSQVFFVYDPSSSTSLLSSVSSDQGKCERGDGQGDGGLFGEGPIAGARPRAADACGVPTDGRRKTHHRWPRLATPAHKYCAADAAAIVLLSCARRRARP